MFSFKANCIDMFSFLITIESQTTIKQYLNDILAQLNNCLKSTNLSIRIAGGECIALLLELADDDVLNINQIDDLYDNLQTLATDSQKSKSKKVLREQRSNFRQILHTFVGDGYSKELIKFGQERLIISSWQQKRYYDTFCSVIGSGLNLHLSQNTLLRDIFDLGPVIVDFKPDKISKFEKVFFSLFNQIA